MLINPHQTAPGLLVAGPNIKDPFFSKSVVLMLEHNSEQAIGLVLNKTLPYECESIVQEHFELSWFGEQSLLLQGGPVAPQSLWTVHEEGWKFEYTSVATGVGVSRSLDSLRKLCRVETRRIRLIIGCAAWGAGQLEEEFHRGDWLFLPNFDPDLIFDVSVDDLWSSAIRHIGIDPMLLNEGNGELH